MSAREYSVRENELLGKWKGSGALRYQNDNSFYCESCSLVFNVECPNCHSKSPTSHHYGHDNNGVFQRIKTDYDRWQGRTWVMIECRKCDYRFKVIVK